MSVCALLLRPSIIDLSACIMPSTLDLVQSLFAQSDLQLGPGSVPPRFTYASRSKSHWSDVIPDTDFLSPPAASLAKSACVFVKMAKSEPNLSSSTFRVLMRVVSGATSPSTVTARFAPISIMRSWKSTGLPLTL